MNKKYIKIWAEIRKAQVHTIDKVWEYDRRIEVLSFPKKWSKMMIKMWLDMKGYPVEDKRIHIDTDYDCSGQVCFIDMKYRKNQVTITEYIDC